MQTACPSCGKKYKVADSSRGKKARCSNPECKSVFVVGASGGSPGGAPGTASPKRKASATQAPAAATAPPASATSSPDDLFGSLSGSSPLDDLLGAEASPMTSPLAGPASAEGPVLAPVRRRRRGNWRKPLLFGGIAAGSIAVVVLLVVGLSSLLSSAGSGSASSEKPTQPAQPITFAKPEEPIVLAKPVPSADPLDWGGFAVPADAIGVFYINTSRLAKSDFIRLAKKGPNTRMGMPGFPGAGPLKLNSADMDRFAGTVEGIFAAMTAKKAPILVLRTRNESTVEELTSLGGPQIKGHATNTQLLSRLRKIHAGIQYVWLRGEFVAQTDTHTFCVTQKEDDLLKALDRLVASEPAPLPAEVGRGVKVAKGDHYVAMLLSETNGPIIPRMPPNPFSQAMADVSPPKWLGLGISTDSYLTVSGELGFAAAADAATIKKKIDELKQMMNAMSQMGPQGASPERAQVELVLKLFNNVKLSQRGETLGVHVKWKVSDLERMSNAARPGP